MTSTLVPQLLPLLEVAKTLCVSPHTVRSWIRKGRLRPVRICRRLLFDPSEITRFLAESELAESASRDIRP
jgi:excisionase family DNA binding protein